MKTVVITGGTGDLGRVVVPRLLREYRCAVLFRDEAQFKKLGQFENLIGIQLDRMKSVAPVYALVHLAGAFAMGGSVEDFSRMLEANLLSAVRAVDAVRPHLEKNGRIVAISSAASLSKPKGMAAYVSAKAALNAFVESLAKEFTANAVLPGTIDTDAKRENVAEVIAFLLSDDAATVNGQLIAMLT
jgi:NAD(P)-dependent dehydrogenase (short-subunit alcohol dehydrogenase family)